MKEKSVHLMKWILSKILYAIFAAIGLFLGHYIWELSDIFDGNFISRLINISLKIISSCAGVIGTGCVFGFFGYRPK